MMFYNYSLRLTNQANFQKQLPRGWRVLFFELTYAAASAYEPSPNVLVGIYNQEYKASVALNVVEQYVYGEPETTFNVWSGIFKDGREVRNTGYQNTNLEKALQYMLGCASGINGRMEIENSPIRVLCKVCGTVSGALYDEGDSSVGLSGGLEWTCPDCGAELEYDQKGNPTNAEVVTPYEGCEADPMARIEIMRRMYRNDVEGLKLKGELIKLDREFDEWREKKEKELKSEPREEFDHAGFWDYIDEFDRLHREKWEREQGFITLYPA